MAAMLVLTRDLIRDLLAGLHSVEIICNERTFLFLPYYPLRSGLIRNKRAFLSPSGQGCILLLLYYSRA